MGLLCIILGNLPAQLAHFTQQLSFQGNIFFIIDIELFSMIWKYQYMTKKQKRTSKNNKQQKKKLSIAQNYTDVVES